MKGHFALVATGLKLLAVLGAAGGGFASWPPALSFSLRSALPVEASHEGR